MLNKLNRLSNNAHETMLELIYDFYGWNSVGIDIEKYRNTDGIGKIRGTQLLCLQEVKKKVPKTNTQCNHILSQILAYKSGIENGYIKHDPDFFIKNINVNDIELYLISTKEYFSIVPSCAVDSLYHQFNLEYSKRYVCPSKVWDDYKYKTMFIDFNYQFTMLDPTLENLQIAVKEAVNKITTFYVTDFNL